MLRYALIGGIFVLFIGTILFNQNPTQINKMGNSNNLSKNQVNLSPPLGSDDTHFLNLPYLENLSGLYNWIYNNIMDTSTSVPEYFSETNRTGNLTDTTHNFEDFSVFLDGLASVANYYDYLLPSYFLSQESSAFYDRNATSQGYYTTVSGDWLQNSTVKEFNSMAQSLLTFVDWLLLENGNPNVFSADQVVANQWTLTYNLFNDPNVQAMNHSTIDSNKYTLDQLMAAIAGFQIHRAYKGTFADSEGTIQTQANNTATAIMNRITNTSGLIVPDKQIFDSFNTFKEEMKPDFLGTVSPNKYLATNAYGIWALVEWYLESGSPLYDQYMINMAQSIYAALNAHLWNSTYNLYMTEASQDMNTIINSTISLKDNAIMLVALKYLFEATGNFTYLNRINLMINSIMSLFKDPTDGVYYKSIDTTTSTVDTDKNFGTEAYLFRAYRRIAALSNEMQCNVTVNSTSFIKDQDVAVNISANSEFVYHQYPNTNNYLYSPFPNASFFFVVRYPNSTQITTQSLTGDLNGKSNFTLNLGPNLPLGVYNVSLRVNYTGFYAVFNSTTFNLISGLSALNFTMASYARAGNIETLNLTMNSTRSMNTSFTIMLSSPCINNETFVMQNITGYNSTILNYTFTLLPNAPLGIDQLNIALMRNNILYFQMNITYDIISPIEVISNGGSFFSVPGANFTFILNLQNDVNITQNFTIQLSGDSFNTVTQNLQINPLASLQTSAIITFFNSVLSGYTSLNINITRNGDNAELYANTVQVNIQPILQIITIQEPTQIQHGETAVILVKVMNNLDHNQTVHHSVDGVNGTDIVLIPGENDLIIPLSISFNPYELGTKIVDFKLIDSQYNLIYENHISYTIQLSPWSLFFGYILPLLIPIVLIVVVRHLDIENKKRLA